VADVYFHSRIACYREFSNFYVAPFEVGGVCWASVEHYYQAQKTDDDAQAAWVRKSQSAGEAKRRGRRVKLRFDWDRVKGSVMLTALRAKFTQNIHLRDLLLGTGDARLHEDSPDDLYWGVRGHDKLGELLMRVRDELRAATLLGGDMREKQWRKDKDDEPVDFVKELGFDNTMGIVGDKTIHTEKLFFVDGFGNNSFNATDEAIEEAIKSWRHDIETLELYLKNGKNNNTHEWKPEP
jgi:hypothetical protein